MKSIQEDIVAQIASLPKEMQREVLDFVEFLRLRHRNAQRQPEDFSNYIDTHEHSALGQAGAKLAANILEPEDFSDWPGFNKSTETKNG